MFPCNTRPDRPGPRAFASPSGHPDQGRGPKNARRNFTLGRFLRRPSKLLVAAAHSVNVPGLQQKQWNAFGRINFPADRQYKIQVFPNNPSGRGYRHAVPACPHRRGSSLLFNLPSRIRTDPLAYCTRGLSLSRSTPLVSGPFRTMTSSLGKQWIGAHLANTVRSGEI